MTDKVQWRRDIEPLKRIVREQLQAHDSSSKKIERVATEVRTVTQSTDETAVRAALFTLGYLR